MNARTALALVAASVVAACSAPTGQVSTFQDPTSPVAGETAPAPAATESTASPTEPAPVVKTDAPIDTCSFGKKTAAGCEVTYDISVDDAADDDGLRYCNGGFNAYNDCTGAPVAISWKDAGDRTPKSAHLELGASIFCADPLLDSSLPQHQDVAVNGASIGGFDGDIAKCFCEAETTNHTFDLNAAALTAFKPGAANSIEVKGPNQCLGLGGLNHTRFVARLVVVY